MIQVISNMPVGTIGLRASGEVSEEDYRDVLVPTINSAMERGKVRLLFVLEDETGYEPGAVWADAKMWFKNLKGWQRLAIVSDADAFSPPPGPCRRPTWRSRPGCGRRSWPAG